MPLTREEAYQLYHRSKPLKLRRGQERISTEDLKNLLFSHQALHGELDRKQDELHVQANNLAAERELSEVRQAQVDFLQGRVKSLKDDLASKGVQLQHLGERVAFAEKERDEARRGLNSCSDCPGDDECCESVSGAEELVRDTIDGALDAIFDTPLKFTGNVTGRLLLEIEGGGYADVCVQAGAIDPIAEMRRLLSLAARG